VPWMMRPRETIAMARRGSLRIQRGSESQQKDPRHGPVSHGYAGTPDRRSSFQVAVIFFVSFVSTEIESADAYAA